MYSHVLGNRNETGYLLFKNEIEGQWNSIYKCNYEF